MIHELKILRVHFTDWKSGIKRCEVRRDDRNYQVGDTLHLLEMTGMISDGPYMSPNFTGEGLTTEVLGILRQHAGLAPGYVLLYCGEPNYDLP